MKNLLHKIGKHAWVYLTWMLAVCVFWSWLFGILTRVPTEEKISIFIGSYSREFTQYDELSASRPEYIREVDLNIHLITEQNFSAFLTAFGTEEADILILPESKLEQEVPQALYASISSEYCAELPNLGLFEVNDKIYGLRIHDKNTHESLISCLDFGEADKEEDYYLLFNRKSLHLGDLSPSLGYSDRNGAIVIAKRLLSL